MLTGVYAGPQDGAGANIKGLVTSACLNSSDKRWYNNINNAQQFFKFCIENLTGRTQYEWASDRARVAYHNTIFLWIGQEEVKKAMEIPRHFKTLEGGTLILHSVRSINIPGHIEVCIVRGVFQCQRDT